jgi:hypothetical protein
MKARIADPEKTSNARQWHDKHVSAVTNNYTTEELLETVFSMWSVPRLYNENQLEFSVSRECEGVAIMDYLRSHQPARTGAVEHGS